jgi:hypothetical protein
MRRDRTGEVIDDDDQAATVTSRPEQPESTEHTPTREESLAAIRDILARNRTAPLPTGENPE